VEEALKRELDTSKTLLRKNLVRVEEALKRELDTSEIHHRGKKITKFLAPSYINSSQVVEEALKRELDTPEMHKLKIQKASLSNMEIKKRNSVHSMSRELKIVDKVAAI
jgi:hypothetical protein